MTPRLAMLHEARHQLQRIGPDNAFICIALILAGTSLMMREEARQIQSEIREALGDCGTVEGWVASESGIYYDALVHHPTWCIQMRMAWLDKLIEKEYDAHR